MVDLNNLEEIKKLDPKDVYGSTELFADQCEQMIEEYYDLNIHPAEYKNIKNIVICGMGGSAYGGYIANSLFFEKLTVPITLVSDYKLPGFVDENSLVFLTSYSGSTEEILSCSEDAKKRNAKIACLTSGGLLDELLKQGYTGFRFNPKNNPSGQPRLGTGYIVLGTIILLNQHGIISVSKVEIQNAISELRKHQEETKKDAIKIAQETIGKIPIVFSAEFLNGNAHIMRNQLNETAKSFSSFSELPELNHHLMEGLKNPQDKKLVVLFLESRFYSENLQKRMRLTQEVVSKNDISIISYETHGSSKLSQMLNVLSFGGYYSLFLGLLYNLDPSIVPWVDYFKEKMKE